MGSSSAPRVSFVVPCYNLAHLLPDCLESILAQTYEDFEILVMDDASPDDTPGVVRRFRDPRVRHVRNEVNLRHLRNYNRGIEMSRGDYVWLISADDRLRQPYALERYVALMERNPAVGYTFCPGVALRDGVEAGVIEYSMHGAADTVFDGRQFLRTLLRSNSVIAASGMVRKRLYERCGAFPLDLPWAGDWYLWLLFALHSDVGYLAEPMVNYREHAQSATSVFMHDPTHPWKAEGIVVVWRIKRAIQATPHAALAADCDLSLTRQYASSLLRYGLGLERFEASLREFAATASEAGHIRVRTFVRCGDEALAACQRGRAAEWYGRALRAAPTDRDAWAKLLLSRLGNLGDALRGGLGAARRGLRGGPRPSHGPRPGSGDSPAGESKAVI